MLLHTRMFAIIVAILIHTYNPSFLNIFSIHTTMLKVAIMLIIPNTIFIFLPLSFFILGGVD